MSTLRRRVARHRDLMHTARTVPVKLKIYMDPVNPDSDPDLITHLDGFWQLPRGTRKTLLRYLERELSASRTSWPWLESPEALKAEQARRAAVLRRQADRMRKRADELEGK